MGVCCSSFHGIYTVQGLFWSPTWNGDYVLKVLGSPVECVECVSECKIWVHWRTGEKSDVMLSILSFERVPGVNYPQSHTQTLPGKELAGAWQVQVSHSLLLDSPSEQFLIPTSGMCGRTSRDSKAIKNHSNYAGFHLNGFENCSMKHHQKLLHKKNLEWNKSPEQRVNGITNGWDRMSLRRSRMKQNWGNTGFLKDCMIFGLSLRVFLSVFTALVLAGMNKQIQMCICYVWIYHPKL